MNRKQFQKWLDTFPEDTIIEVAIQEEPSLYQSYGAIDFLEVEFGSDSAGKGWEYIDFNDNKFVKPGDNHFGKRYLQLGERT